MLPTLKYTKDLFYIAPLLHRELPPDLEKLIMLDIDLEFKWDPKIQIQVNSSDFSLLGPT